MSDQESVPTWELVKASSVPKGRRIVGCTWAFDIKRNADGSIARWKARLCAQGFSQMYGYDYHHTYSNTVSWSSVRLICSLAANKGMTITAVDIKTAFLNGVIEEEIYMKQPKGYAKYDGDEPLLCKLLRAIYGLKQSGRVWEHRLVKKLLEMAFIRCDIDPCLFTKTDTGEQIILAIFVDDIIIASTSDSLRADTVKELQTDFRLTDQGILNWILGVRVTQAPSLITLDQQLYIEDMISALGSKINHKKGRATPCNDQVLHLDTHDKTSECNPEYRKHLGKIGWLANTTRPDISFIFSYMARFNLSNGEPHMAVLEGVYQYLGATKNWMLKYGKGCDTDLRDLITSNSDFLAQAFDDMTPFAFTDTSYGGEKPMAGYGIVIGGGLVDWKGYRLPLTPTSTCAGEYIAATRAATELVTTCDKATFLGIKVIGPPPLFCDNKSACLLSDSNTSSKRMKHIATRIAFLRELIIEKRLTMFHISTHGQFADIFTKPLAADTFHRFRRAVLTG